MSKGMSLRWMASWLIRASTTTLCQIKMSSPMPLTLRSSSNEPKFCLKPQEPAKTFVPGFWNAMVVASGPVWTGLGCMSSRMDEAMRYVHITLCPGMQAKFRIYCSSGSNVSSRTAGHMMNTSTHSPLETYKMAYAAMTAFIPITLTHEMSLSLKFVRPFFRAITT